MQYRIKNAHHEGDKMFVFDMKMWGDNRYYTYELWSDGVLWCNINEDEACKVYNEHIISLAKYFANI